MWHDLFVTGIPPAEKVLRTVLVYLVVALLLRLIGKRDTAQLNTMDLVVMLLLANVVQNAIIGPEYSLSGAVIGAIVLLGCDSLLVRAQNRWTWAWRLLEGAPVVLARDGSYESHSMRRLGIRKSDVAWTVQAGGGQDVHDVQRVVLAPGGKLLVQLRRDKRSATVADTDALNERLARIERLLGSRSDESGPDSRA